MIEIGSTVTVVNEISQRDYTEDSHFDRNKYKGKRGTVIAKHDSHGLCYDVRFKGWGQATYDPDELIITPF